MIYLVFEGASPYWICFTAGSHIQRGEGDGHTSSSPAISIAAFATLAEVDNHILQNATPNETPAHKSEVLPNWLAFLPRVSAEDSVLLPALLQWHV